MPESIPICSHTFMFYQGTLGELEQLEKKFKKALSNHVRFFSNTKDGSSFVVLTSSDKVVGVQSRLNKLLWSELGINRRNSISRITKYECEGLYKESAIDDFLYQSFKFKVYNTDGVEPSELPDFILSLEESNEVAVDIDGNQLFLFDITNAKPYEAFMICKLSAILSLYTVYFDKSNSKILPPFPRYRSLSDIQFGILYFLKEVKQCPAPFTKSPWNCTISKDGYVLSKDIARVVGFGEKQPGKHLNYLENQGLIKFKKIMHVCAQRPQKAYIITHDGEFFLRYSRRDALMNEQKSGSNNP